MKARQSKVVEIISAAYDGVDAVVDKSTSADEVFSAYITMARNAVVVARKAGADMTRVRSMIYLILMEAHDKEPQ